MALSYGYEKLTLAMHSMATSSASIQERIAHAYMFHLIHLRREDLPDGLWWIMQEISAQVTAKEAIANEGKVMATVNQMSDEDAVAIAHKIASLFDQVSAETHRD